MAESLARKNARRKMRPTRAPVGIMLLLLCLLCPPPWLGATEPLVTMASASLATASWKTVWSDDFQSENVDMTKWERPGGGSITEAGSEGAVAERGGRQMNDTVGVGRGSSSPEESPHHTPPPSSPRRQTYIGAHDYLVMVGAAAPSSPPSQLAEGDDLHAARRSPESDSSNSIRTSVDFLYGRVEVRAKVASGGLSGFWLMPSEERLLGYTPCARVAIAEIWETGADQAESFTSSAKSSIRFGDYEESEWGCTSSNFWPREGEGCVLPADDGTGWSDNFHVYSLEWEADEFRWYVDGIHYCTKTSWFSNHPHNFPAPFNEAFHLTMGVEAAGSVGMDDSSGTAEGDLASSPVIVPEMLVDYVRIAQGPRGSMFPPADVADGRFGLAADEGGASAPPPPRAVDIFINALAVSACVLGPFMAITGLRRPRMNTILLGVEIGAFKAANAAYLVSGSYAMALAGAVTFGVLVGFIAIRHRGLARWNTVAGLAIPVLFLLIDIGMISDIGSRYVCWAIFFVLTVSFAVLVFPPEHHAIGFAVASAATGSCVLKLGLGWLLGEPGELFKILDDPLGDRCHASRVCQYLNFVMGAMFLVGLCFQWILRPSPEDKLPGLGRSEASMDKQRQPLFTPPRSRFPWRGPVVRSSTMPPTRKSTAATGGDFEPKGGREASGSDARERQPPFGAVGGERDRQQERQRPEDDDTLSESYDDDEAFILGLPGARRDDGGVWQRVTSGARRMLDRVLHPISSYRHHQVPVSVPPDSPTPVPMPPSGPESNTVVSNQGDTIELVIHSPHKGSLGHRQPPGWLGSGSGRGSGSGSGNNGGENHNRPLPPLSLRDGAKHEEEGSERRQQGMSAGSSSSSGDYDDALSILSASELVAAEDLAVATSQEASQPDAEAAANEGAPSGRLADAFSDKWGAWVQDARSSDDGSADGGDDGHRSRGGARSTGGDALGRDGGRSARAFDHEALLLSPYVPPPPDAGVVPNLEAGANPGAADTEDNRDTPVASQLSYPSSSSSVYDERWVWRHRDGVLPPSSTANTSGRASPQGGPTVADGQDLPAGLGGIILRNTVGGETSGRREDERGVSSRTGPAGVLRLKGAAEASAVVPPDDTHSQGTSGGSPAASLREIDL